MFLVSANAASKDPFCHKKSNSSAMTKLSIYQMAVTLLRVLQQHEINNAGQIPRQCYLHSH